MKNYLRVLLATTALLANSAQSFANFAMSPSGATTAFAIDAANQGTALCAAASTECGASVLINTAGAPLGVAATPMQVSLANTGANATAVKVDGSAVTQPVSLASTTITGSVAVTNAGTFAAQLTGATNNINNIAGTVSLPTGASTAALQPTNAAQGSTTSGQTGPLVQCSVTTAAPTYTTAQTDPVNCDTAGNVRVNVMTATGLAQGSTTSGQTGSLIMAAVTTGLQAFTNAQTSPLTLDLNGGMRTAVVAQTRVARNFPGCTVGAASAQCLATNTAVQYLSVENTHASNAIACAFGGAAVLNSSGSFQLASGQAASWGPNTGGVPTGALNCIASGASTPLYLEWN